MKSAMGLIISGLMVLAAGVVLIAIWGLTVPDGYPVWATVAATVGLVLLLSGIRAAARAEEESIE